MQSQLVSHPRTQIRNLMLYPAELRVHNENASISALLAKAGRDSRQGRVGTKRKSAAHCGTLVAQSAAQSAARLFPARQFALDSLPYKFGLRLFVSQRRLDALKGARAEPRRHLFVGIVDANPTHARAGICHHQKSRVCDFCCHHLLTYRCHHLLWQLLIGCCDLVLEPRRLP